MKVALSTGAEQDLLDGFEFYEFQQTHLGWYFLDSLYSDIDSLGLFAGIHPKRFPFSIYYRLVDDTTTVIAVLDSRQNSSKTHTRLTPA